MNKNIVIILVISITILGVGLFFVSNTTKESSAPEEMDQNNEQPPTESETGESSQYITYSKAAFDDASENRRVLFFYASWCPTCRPVDAAFTKDTGTIPKDVTIVRVSYKDTDTNQEEKDLARQYGVTYQHTFVQIDGQGNEITKWNGGSIDELLANVQ